LLDPHRIVHAAQTHHTIGKCVQSYDEIDSTNTEAFRQTNLPDGAVLTAEFQTQGRGRIGKKWHAAKGENLLLSIVLHPKCEASRMGLLSLMAAEAVAQTVEQLTQQAPEIKYPNDVLIANKKIAGILVEARSNSTETHTAVVGIGLNVNQTVFDEGVHATSLKLLTEQEFDRTDTLITLLKFLDTKYQAFLKGETIELLKAWKSRCAMIGKVVVFRHKGAICTGKAIDVDEIGYLWIEKEGKAMRYAQTEVSDVRY
jgi:BirA family biotin operon repressor/biotin-[acetyl-CoA-carboxylase] ligase